MCPFPLVTNPKHILLQDDDEEEWNLKMDEYQIHRRTLAYYDKNSEEYYEETIFNNVKEMYNIFTSYLPLPAKILDFGSGVGRDTKYFLDCGYNVDSVDGSRGLARIAKDKLGIDTLVSSFQTVDLPQQEYDGIWAMASLLHLPTDSLRQVVAKLYGALKPNGVLFCSFKEGEGSFVDERGRYYRLMNENELLSLAENNRLQCISCSKFTFRDQRWIKYLGRRLSSKI